MMNNKNMLCLFIHDICSFYNSVIRLKIDQLKGLRQYFCVSKSLKIKKKFKDEK